jgi:hypothetical protein
MIKHGRATRQDSPLSMQKDPHRRKIDFLGPACLVVERRIGSWCVEQLARLDAVKTNGTDLTACSPDVPLVNHDPGMIQQGRAKRGANNAICNVLKLNVREEQDAWWLYLARSDTCNEPDLSRWGRDGGTGQAEYTDEQRLISGDPADSRGGKRHVRSDCGPPLIVRTTARRIVTL